MFSSFPIFQNRKKLSNTPSKDITLNEGSEVHVIRNGFRGYGDNLGARFPSGSMHRERPPFKILPINPFPIAPRIMTKYSPQTI